MIILPLAIREIFSSWQMLSPPFLAMAPNYFCNESGHENFQNLQEWQDFANVIDKGGSLDKCSVYDLDYTNVDAMKEANNGSQLTNQTRYCKSWIFAENETQTLITEVSKFKIKSVFKNVSQVSQRLTFSIIFFSGGSYSIHFINVPK